MIDYKKIKKSLYETLERETSESLNEWLDAKEKEEMLADLGEGEYMNLDVESGLFEHAPNISKSVSPILAGEYDYATAA